MSSNMAAIIPPADSGSTPSTSIATLIEQFQKFIASQPHAMSASSHIGLPSSSTPGISSSIWVLDSGASHHMSPNSNSFLSIKSAPSVSVMTVDGTPMPLAGIGSICTPKMSFSDVYHIPNLTLNLVSVGQLCDSGFSVNFTNSCCYVQDPHYKKLIGRGHRQGGFTF